MARRLATVVAACCLALVGLPDAEAALFLRFEPSQAAPGQIVRATTVGEGAFRPVPSREEFPVLFVRSSGRRDLGVLVIDDDGNGSATFEVPLIPSGRYGVFAVCPTCSPPGTLPVGELTVLGGASENKNSPTPDVVGKIVMVMFIAVAAAAIWLLRLRRRPRASADR